MAKKIIFPLVIILLLTGFYLSQDFELIAVGVAILIFGISLLETGFRNSAEGRLKYVLQSVGGNFGKSFGLGFGSTVVFQSSSLITVVAISFLSAGLLGLKSGMAIIFGSNLGTTATSWLIALFGLKLKISTLAAPFIVFGVLLYFQKKKGLNALGHILLGLGFFFTGIFVMQEGFKEMQGAVSLDMVSSSGVVRNLLFLGIGIVLTLILQSSSASMAIVLTAIFEGQIQYEDGLILAIGANVGTTITAIIGSLGANYAGKQVALGHLIFNVVTAIIAMFLLPFFVMAVDLIANNLGVSADDYTVKLSIFHSLFNIIGIIIFIPIVNLLCTFLERVIPPKVEPTVQPRFLNESILEFPQGARLTIIEELKALFVDSKEILLKGLGLEKANINSIKALEDSIDSKKSVLQISIEAEYTQSIKPIYSQILKYASLLEEPRFSQEVRYISRKIASCLKDMDDLNNNVHEKLKSDNGIVLKEYNNFRFLIAIMIYEINQVSDASSLSENKDRIESLRKEAKKNEANIGDSIHPWIVQKEISSKDVSSMLNDAHYTYNICRNLSQVAELLYSDKYEDMVTAADTMVELEDAAEDDY